MSINNEFVQRRRNQRENAPDWHIESGFHTKGRPNPEWTNVSRQEIREILDAHDAEHAQRNASLAQSGFYLINGELGLE